VSIAITNTVVILLDLVLPLKILNTQKH